MLNKNNDPEVKNASVTESTEDYPSWHIWKKRRYIVAMLAFLGYFNIYALRVNLSIAIVPMTENKTITHENGTVTYHKEFDWDSKMQGFVLSSFFYGYICTQVFGGWLASRIGGKKVFGVGLMVTAAFTVITPFLVHYSVYLFIAIRIIEGIFEGVAYPCMIVLWSRWSPPLERSRLTTFTFSGSYVGTVVSMPVCAYLADYFGWESIFYVFGVIALIWCVFWFWIVAESPNEDPYISKAELNLILPHSGEFPKQKRVKHPWKSILLSVPVWAIFISNFCENWGFYTLLTLLPKFMKEILNFDLGQSGIMSGLPYLAMAITMQFSGHFADWFLVKGILTTTQVRKAFNCFAFISQTIFILGATFWLSPVGSVICLTFAVGCGAFAWSGFSVNYLDIAPQHSGVIAGFGNTVATLPGILSPIIAGYILVTPNTEEWQIIFYITSAIYLFGCVVYGIFASAEVQPWALETETLKQDDDVKDKGHINISFQSEL